MGSFDMDQFLARPLVARVAADGPTIRSVWYLYEDGAFWWITGSYAVRFQEAITRNPRLALVVDTCDLASGEVFKVTAEGIAETRSFDEALAKRLLARYLGSDASRWDPRFQKTLASGTGEVLIRLVPETLKGRDLSFVVDHGRTEV